MSETVRDYMAINIETLAPDDSMESAVLLSRRLRIRHIPIVENGVLVGIVTDRDLKRAMPSPLAGTDQQEYQRVAETTHLHQVMTRSPMTIGPDAPLKEAVRILCDKKYGALPVVDDDRLVGIVTKTDLLRAFLRFLERQT